MEQRIVKGSTATLVSYPRLRPSSLYQAGEPVAEAYLMTPENGLGQTAVTVTVEDVTATVEGDATAGALELAVATSTAWTAGRQYLLQDADGVLVVESAKTITGKVLVLAQPLPRDLAPGAAIGGFALLYTLTADDTAAVGESSIRWRTLSASIPVTSWIQLFRIVERLPTALLTPTSLLAAYPSLHSMTASTDPTWEQTISAAWEHRVVPLLEEKGVFDEDVISDEALVPLHAMAVLQMVHSFDPRTASDFRASVNEEWNRTISTTFARRGYAEQDQDEASATRSPGADAAQRGRMRMVL